MKIGMVLLTVVFFVLPAVACESNIDPRPCPKPIIENISYTTNTNIVNDDVKDLVSGAKADAPNLIRLTDNLTVGVEAYKDLLNTNPTNGWGVFGKVTYTGTFLDFSKKRK